MAIVKTEMLGPFLGINNRLPRHALTVNNDNLRGAYLADAVGVDIDATGRLSRADGATNVAALTTGRSLFSREGTMLLADGLALKKVVSLSPFSTSTIDSVGSGRVAYEAINGEIFYSDGDKIGCLEVAGSVRAVGIQIPTSLSLSVTSGSLIPAWYQATITYFVGDEEGSAYPSQNIELTAMGGVALSLPTPPAGITAIGVYLSGPNGEVPLLHSIISPVGSITLTTLATGRQCLTQFRSPMPAGEILTHIPGYLLSASGEWVYYSEYMNFAMTNPVKGYIKLPADVSVMIGNENGVYIVADRTYWLTGLGTAEIDLIPLQPYGAVKFSQSRHPTEKKVFWLSEKGVCVGDDQGQVVNLQEKNLLLNLSGTGASVFIEGNNRIVATNG